MYRKNLPRALLGKAQALGFGILLREAAGRRCVARARARALGLWG